MHSAFSVGHFLGVCGNLCASANFKTAFLDWSAHSQTKAWKTKQDIELLQVLKRNDWCGEGEGEVNKKELSTELASSLSSPSLAGFKPHEMKPKTGALFHSQKYQILDSERSDRQLAAFSLLVLLLPRIFQLLTVTLLQVIHMWLGVVRVALSPPPSSPPQSKTPKSLFSWSPFLSFWQQFSPFFQNFLLTFVQSCPAFFSKQRTCSDRLAPPPESPSAPFWAQPDDKPSSCNPVYGCT